MPNWCTNRVTITGDPKDVKEVKDFLKASEEGEEVVFSFQALVPMPTELIGSRSPATVLDTQKEVDEYNAEHATDRFPHTAISLKTSTKLKLEYGTDNWYDWCNENWGTKWGACDPTLDDDEEDYIVYRFDTAWGPPNEIYDALIGRFKNIHVQWFYDEPGMGFAGYLPE